MQDKIFSILMSKDTVSWKTLIFQVIKEYNMDPWDIDVSLLANKYIQLIRKMKEFDFFISGKVLIAASFLLRLKSVKLVDEDLLEFDRLIAETQRPEDEFIADFYSDLERDWAQGTGVIATEPPPEQPMLLPRTPQPRKRKVSVYDLVEALQKALEVHERKVLREMKAPKVKVPEKRRDITEVIREIYEKIKSFFSKNKSKKLTFSQLIPSNNKEDVIQTFVPLLHLSHIDERKIDLLQKEHFGEIQIKLLK
ncbi:hypothetical protein DRJ48_01350 [Candidatus Woesearchaeota archaeon]|nr:MAG: hypothetical protein DRJ48_01350 [Candidatus Woesearchaeota archaeon]